MEYEVCRMAADYLSRSNGLREALGVPAAALLEPSPLGQGEHNANFTFVHPLSRERLVLRINFASQLGLERQIEYEYAALQALAPSSRTPLPVFVDGSKHVIGHGVLVMEHRQGAHLDFNREDDVVEAARIMADIHATTPSASIPLLAPRDALMDLYDEDMRLFSAYRKNPLADSALVRRIERLFQLVEPVVRVSWCPPAAECAHILNTEAVPSHFLIPRDGAPGSMVDWEKPILGEVARDVAYFVAPTTTIWDTDYIFDAPSRAAFVESYWQAVDGRFARGSFDERFDAYLKMNCLRGIAWSALAWTEYADPSRPLQNEKTRKKLRVYLSDAYLDMLEQGVFLN